MLKFTGLGQHLVVPWKVVVAGAPNAGKSSLVNALAGFPRSIVTPIPGTTRDAVSTLLAIDGWPVELIDTAGIHLAAVGLEKEGIELARAQIANSDLCLWVMDVTAPPVQAESAFLADPVQVLNVANKVDRLPAWQTETCCPVSALTGEGLLGLCQQMSQHLCPEAPQAGVAVPFCSEVLAALQTIDQALVDGKIDSALANCNSWL